MVDLQIKYPNTFLNVEMRGGILVSRKMKEVWLVEMDLAQELLRVCKKNNLKIFADFGTLIGAVRHKGFIPWDDDMDFSMFREDYEKLCRIAPKEFRHPYFFQYSNDGKDFVNGHAKLRNSMTTGIIKNEMNRNLRYNQGIFIDIFPLDNVSDNKCLCFIQRFFAHFFYIMMLLFAYFSSRYFESDSLFRIPKKIIHQFMDKPFRRLQLVSYRLMMFFCMMFSSKKTKSVAGLSFRGGNVKQLRDDYNDVINLNYEFLELPIVRNYDRVLTRWFGEWRVPQMGKNDHGEVFFDTDKPYSFYLH